MRRQVFFLLIATGALGCRSEPSPSDTIDRLVEAVQARDSVEVARYIDVGRVAESSVDPLFQAATILEQNDPDGFRAQTGGMGVEMLEQFRPMLAPLMETVFWQMMLHPEELQEGPLSTLIGDKPLPFEQLGENYQGVSNERSDGDDVIVSVGVANEAANHSVTIDMRLERGEDGWKVVSFENLADTIASVMGGGA
jgi:hypothetical protein